MELDCKVQGFLGGQRQAKRQTKGPGDLFGAIRGRHIDELEIQVTLRSGKDVDRFIRFLLEAQTSFTP